MTVETTAAADVGSGVDQVPGSGDIAATLARRSLFRIVRLPAAVLPTVAMPVFLLIAFSGSFSSVTDIPGFPTDEILNWVAPYAILQGGSFAGVGVAQSVANDVENGFYDRLLMSPARRVQLLLGPVVAAAIRVVLPFAAVMAVFLAGGARLEDPFWGSISVLVATMGLSVAATLWGLALVYRLRSQRAGGLIQLGVFVSMFLSIGQVPLAVMEGWLHAVARLNPLTNVMRFSRQGFIGSAAWETTWPGLLVIAIAVLGFGSWALAGIRRMAE